MDRVAMAAALLALPFPLNEAQEVIALEQGYNSWAELKQGLKKAPKAIALNFSRNVRSTASGTLSKKPSVRCILSGSIQRTARICGSRSTRRRLIDSGRSIATKSRLPVISLFARHFVITQGGAIGETRHPRRKQAPGFRSRARFITYILTCGFG